jgi:hypothetical protein
MAGVKLQDDPKVQALIAKAHAAATKAALAHAVTQVKEAAMPSDLVGYTPKHAKAVAALHKSIITNIKSGPQAE